MIRNIVDNRTRQYRWKAITAIVEPTYHDNSRADSDQAEETISGSDYDQREEISLADAVAWAQSFPMPVTLYLYDLGQGINIVGGSETQHFQASAARFRPA